MVTEVTAYAADDGTVFPSHGEAARHDAYSKLKAANIFKHETITAIINNAPIICDALNSLLDEPQ